MTVLDKVSSAYRDAFSKHGRSSASVLCPKARHDVRFAGLLQHIDLKGKSLLDYGCGLGHLCDYLSTNNIAVDYLGVDIVEEFIDSNKTAHPTHRFEKHESPSTIDQSFDVVLASGVFNLRYLSDSDENLKFVLGTVRELFKLSKFALTIDFMTTHVDFVQTDAFHMDPSFILHHAITNLSRRAVINHSYMPYEFSLTVIKENQISKTAGLYEQ